MTKPITQYTTSNTEISVKLDELYTFSTPTNIFKKIGTFFKIRHFLSKAKGQELSEKNVTIFKLTDLAYKCDNWLLNWLLKGKVQSVVFSILDKMESKELQQFISYAEVTTQETAKNKKRIRSLCAEHLFYSDGSIKWKSQLEVINSVLSQIQKELSRKNLTEEQKALLKRLEQKYSTLQKTANSGQKTLIPYWYHGTSAENLEKILSDNNPTIKVKQQSKDYGAWLSTKPELDKTRQQVITLSSNVPRNNSEKTIQFSGSLDTKKIWHGFKKNIPLFAETIAYVAVSDEKTKNQIKEIFKKSESLKDIKVILTTEMQLEHKILSVIRKNFLIPKIWTNNLQHTFATPNPA